MPKASVARKGKGKGKTACDDGAVGVPSAVQALAGSHYLGRSFPPPGLARRASTPQAAIEETLQAQRSHLECLLMQALEVADSGDSMPAASQSHQADRDASVAVDSVPMLPVSVSMGSWIDGVIMQPHKDVTKPAVDATAARGHMARGTHGYIGEANTADPFTSMHVARTLAAAQAARPSNSAAGPSQAHAHRQGASRSSGEQLEQQTSAARESGHSKTDREKRRDALEAQRQRLFQRTELCRFFQLGDGRCRNGEDCPYAHTADELRDRPNLAKTSVCRQWTRGKCWKSSSECRFAHGSSELRKPR
eukprot:TRINITY_DN40159_c0_g1_i1.p1 TRINITY_DN40159_c0_g1~~TRINITY_DN40159_c0_g1_i1.p1  ORF type:complete len:307 (+),score=46.65 TRINITY_DN40159_c0_g1_i1:210-1130(+)